MSRRTDASTAAVEGSCVFKLIDSDTFILMYDVYTSGNYEFAVSTDLKNFTKDSSERKIREFDRQIRDVKHITTSALNLEEKLVGQKQIRALEATRNGKRKSLFEAQDEIDRKRGELIAMMEGKLQAGTGIVELFKIGWELR